MTFCRFKRVTYFNPKLARTISLCLDFKCECLRKCRCRFRNDLKPSAMPEISTFLTELYLWTENIYGLGQEEFGETPNFLNRLSFLVESWGDEITPKFLPLLNLRVLSIVQSDERGKDHPIGHLKTILQGLLKSAHQLEELSIFTNEKLLLAPDLELSSNKLKILKFGALVDSNEFSSLSSSSISGMFDKFAKSLEKLEIGVCVLKGFECTQVCT